MFVFFTSCNNEINFDNELISEINPENNVRKINGILSFKSKESLKNAIENVNGKEKYQIENYFEKFYNDGFKSLNSIINKENRKLINEFMSHRRNIQSRNEGQDMTFSIPDAVFAAYINDKNEIIVDNSLYKFTERGLFFGELQDSVKVRETALNSTNLVNRRPIDICNYRIAEGGVKEINNKVSRFVAPMPVDGCESGDSGGGSGSSVHPDIQLNNLIQNLEDCNDQTNWVQNIFGTYNYCHEYFNDDEYRFELDYWNQNWWVYASVGVEAETHEDGWFWWNNVTSDEIVLGINKVYLTYTAPQPDFKVMNYVTNTLYNFNHPPLYMFDGRFLIKTNNSIYDPVEISVTSNRLPFFNRAGDALLNIYLGDIEGHPIGDEGFDVFSDAHVRQLYQLGIDFLQSEFSSQKEFYVTVQRNENIVDVLFFGNRKRRYLVRSVETIFDDDYSLIIGGGYDGNEWTFDWTAPLDSPSYLGEYNHIEVDVYGAARRGSEWRGLRLFID